MTPSRTSEPASTQESIEREFYAMVRAFRKKDPLLAPLLAFHLLAEDMLDRIIGRWLPRSDRLGAARLTFYQKLLLAASFDALPQETVEGLEILNSVRNKLAHRKDYKPTFDDIRSIGSPFAEHLQRVRESHREHADEDIFASARTLFFATAQQLHLDLNAALHILKPPKYPKRRRFRSP